MKIKKLNESLIDNLNSLPYEKGMRKASYELVKEYQNILNQFPVGTILKHNIDAGEEKFTKVEDGEYGWWEHFRAPWKITQRITEFDLAHWLAGRANITRSKIIQENLNNMKIKKLNESKCINESNIKHIYYHNDPGGLKRGQWLDVKEEDGKLYGKWNFKGDDDWSEITNVEEMPYHNFHGARPAKTFTWGGWRFWLDDEVENFWDIEGKRISGDFEIPGMPHVKRKKVDESKSIKIFGACKKKLDEDMSNNSMTILPLSGLNADGFTVIIKDDSGEEIFNKEYRYGTNASYDRRFAKWAEKDVEHAKKYNWKTPRALKPYVTDIIDELCSKYNIDKNTIEFAPGKNAFAGGKVSDSFVDKMKQKIFEVSEDYDESEDDEYINTDNIKEVAKAYNYYGNINDEIMELGDDPDTLKRIYSDIINVGAEVRKKQLGQWRFLLQSETDFDEPVIETEDGYYVVSSRGRSIALTPIKEEDIFYLNESYKVKFFQVFEAPKSPKENGKMIGQRGSLEDANAFGKKKAGEGNYIIKAVCDDGKVRNIDNDTKSDAFKMVNESMESWDSARVIDLVRYYLDRGNPPINTLANKIMDQMREEGSVLPTNITDFYDKLYTAIDNYESDSLEEGLKDYRFEVSCNDEPTQIVRTIANDNESAVNYAKHYYAQEHTTYADDRLNNWNIRNLDEERLAEASYGYRGGERVKVKDYAKDFITKKTIVWEAPEDEGFCDVSEFKTTGLYNQDTDTLTIPANTKLQYEGIQHPTPYTEYAVYSLPEYNNAKIYISFDYWQYDFSSMVKTPMSDEERQKRQMSREANNLKRQRKLESGQLTITELKHKVWEIVNNSSELDLYPQTSSSIKPDYILIRLWARSEDKKSPEIHSKLKDNLIANGIPVISVSYNSVHYVLHIKIDKSILYVETNNEGLNEASYGGAFDIEDDQLFTREDIENASEEVVDHINETFKDKFQLGGTWFENGEWIVNVQTEDGMEEYEEKVKIDFRKIRNPFRDLKEKYALEIAAALISKIKEEKYGMDEAFEGTYSDKFRSLIKENAADNEFLASLCNDIIRYCPEEDLKDLWNKNEKHYTSSNEVEEELKESLADYKGIRIGDTLTTKSGHKIHINDMVVQLSPFEKQGIVTFDYSYELVDGETGNSQCSVFDLKNMLNESLNEGIDGWDNRTGVIKRIANYLSNNPEAIAPVGYIKKGSKEYESEAQLYGDYVTTPFGKISTDDLMVYAKEHNLLEESMTDAEPIEPGAAVGVASILNGLIIDEYEAIEGYNTAIVNAEAEGYGDMVKVLTDIQAEENIHVGQLQELMKMVDPNADKAAEGEQEAAEQLNDEAPIEGDKNKEIL